MHLAILAVDGANWKEDAYMPVDWVARADMGMYIQDNVLGW